MFVARSIAADHKDLIHDVSFDFHGRRMATCSSDQSVKVRRRLREAEVGSGRRPRKRGASDGLERALQPESGSPGRRAVRTPAPPRRGTSARRPLWGHGRRAVLHACAVRKSPALRPGRAPARPGGAGRTLGGCFLTRASPPPALPLPCACHPGSGFPSAARGMRASVGPVTPDPPVKRTTLVDSRTSVTDVKFAPKHMGLMLATCSADGIVRIYEAPDVMNLSQWSLQHEISCKLSCSCISWNPSSSRAHAPMIAVGSDDSSPNAMAKVQIFEYNENIRKYAKAETLLTVTDPVHDIAFAPNLGRSFHTLAVATKDVRIFTLKPMRKELTSSGGPTKFEIHIVAQFDNHNSQVWRVSWNITGTVLASSGDDGCVRLWKANYMDNWKCTGILKGNGSPVSGSSQQGNSSPSLGSNIPNLHSSLNGSSAGRYFFPPLDSPRAGSRWSSYTQLLPPPPPPPPLEHSCDADTAGLQYPHPRRRYLSRPLNPLPENEGV
ncbi:nucleoporin SEH1 [Octodon degus]|uniref:Nucleoporin SEH1 n=1 Tax=Octodon degus TaxID=10160 RepID=A0A6P3V8L4_OCTDE|nr:nucleoporin SEH1 [Octodon degus]